MKRDEGYNANMLTRARPTVAQTHKEQLLDVINRKNIPRKKVDVNSDGHIIADKVKDPELYDWAVNG